MRISKPLPGDVFVIDASAQWPTVVFETDAMGPHGWHWTIAWGTYSKSGQEATPDGRWDATATLRGYGGMLTVRAQAKQAVASVTVKLRGTNPTAHAVTQYLQTKANSAGFDKIVGHESKFKHFNTAGEPIKSFDNGFGMCQLTTPVPAFHEVWNWKLNVDAGLKLFAQKRVAAVSYLSQLSRTYTADQLTYEAVSRWNGGSYHVWDAKKGQWVRPAHILCDSVTGNIGWDLNDADNKGKTEVELHKRDAAAYSKRPGADANWKYSGVCYADRLLGV